VHANHVEERRVLLGDAKHNLSCRTREHVPNPPRLVLAKRLPPAFADGTHRLLVIVDPDLGPGVKVEIGHRSERAVVLAKRMVGEGRLVVARVNREIGKIVPAEPFVGTFDAPHARRVSMFVPTVVTKLENAIPLGHRKSLHLTNGGACF